MHRCISRADPQAIQEACEHENMRLAVGTYRSRIQTPVEVGRLQVTSLLKSGISFTASRPMSVETTGLVQGFEGFIRLGDTAATELSIY